MARRLAMVPARCWSRMAICAGACVADMTRRRWRNAVG
jgi:hypothetical protein